MAKFYAVRKGRETGIFHTWDECKKQVQGFSGASYKSFGTLWEAEQFMEDSEVKKEMEQEEVLGRNCEAYAFTDGSYNDATGLTGGGGFLVHNGKEYQFLVRTTPEDVMYNSMNNVGGEILAAVAALKKAKELGIKSLCVYHDYEGVGKWACGEWKANKEATKKYVSFVENCGIDDLQFVHVTGHSGVAGNETADELAKYAVGLADGELRVKYPNMQWVSKMM